MSILLLSFVEQKQAICMKFSFILLGIPFNIDNIIIYYSWSTSSMSYPSSQRLRVLGSQVMINRLQVGLEFTVCICTDFP